jgi:hypothetical protein
MTTQDYYTKVRPENIFTRSMILSVYYRYADEIRENSSNIEKLTQIDLYYFSINAEDKRLIKDLILHNRGFYKELSIGLTVCEVIHSYNLTEKLIDESHPFAPFSDFRTVEEIQLKEKLDEAVKESENERGFILEKLIEEIINLELLLENAKLRRLKLAINPVYREPITIIEKIREQEWSRLKKHIQVFYKKKQRANNLNRKSFYEKILKREDNYSEVRLSQTYSRVGSFVEKVKEEDRELIFITVTSKFSNKLSDISDNYNRLETAIKKIGKLGEIKHSYKMFVYEAHKSLNPHLHFVVAPIKEADIDRLVNDIFKIVESLDLGRTEIVLSKDKLEEYTKRNKFDKRLTTGKNKGKFSVNFKRQFIVAPFHNKMKKGVVSYIAKYITKQFSNVNNNENYREEWYGIFLKDVLNLSGDDRKNRVRLVRHSQLFVSQQVVKVLNVLSREEKIKEKLNLNGFKVATDLLVKSAKLTFIGKSFRKDNFPNSSVKQALYDKSRDEFIFYDRKRSRAYNSVGEINKIVKRFSSLFKIPYRDAHKRVFLLMNYKRHIHEVLCHIEALKPEFRQQIVRDKYKYKGIPIEKVGLNYDLNLDYIADFDDNFFDNPLMDRVSAYDEHITYDEYTIDIDDFPDLGEHTEPTEQTDIDEYIENLDFEVN